VLATVAVVLGAASAAAGSASPHADTTTTVTSPPNQITMSFVGDTDLGNTPKLVPNPTAYLAPVKKALNADIEFFNLEGTLTSSTDSKCGGDSSECYAFRNPPSFAQYYEDEGFTVANSANNHSHDFGNQGVLDTSAALKKYHLVQAGLPGQIGIVNYHGVKVAFCDFAPYTNTNNMLNFAAAKTLIQKAKGMANFVVVYMHAGAEGPTADHVTGKEEHYVGEDRGNPELFAKSAINDGASLVVASAPHVLRGMEFYRGHLIAYSLGDFADYYNFSSSGDLALSGILHVTLTSTGQYVGARFLPTILTPAGKPSLDPLRRSAAFVVMLSREDFGTSAVNIANNDVIIPPKGALG
jgi:hypothetical protein